MRSSRVPHLVRGSIAASTATFVALIGHVSGGGSVPGLLGILAPLILSLLVCVLLAGRRLSLIRLSISVIASQALFHTLFVLGTSPGGAALSPMQGHKHDAMVMPPISPGTVQMIQSDATMWLSHLVAALLTVAFLYRGEQAMRRLWDLADRFVIWVQSRIDRPLVLPIAAPAPRARFTTNRASWSVLSQIQGSTLCRRGPPASY